MPADEEIRRYRVRGRVQGVGFRAFVWRETQGLAVRGWVRNVADGTVEVVAAGDRAAQKSLERILRQGPRWSRVEGVDVSEAAPDEAPDAGFSIRSDRW